ncbi:MAG TPA: hypothetical protein VF398_04785 [bacterium]
MKVMPRRQRRGFITWIPKHGRALTRCFSEPFLGAPPPHHGRNFAAYCPLKDNVMSLCAGVSKG